MLYYGEQDVPEVHLVDGCTLYLCTPYGKIPTKYSGFFNVWGTNKCKIKGGEGLLK